MTNRLERPARRSFSRRSLALTRTIKHEQGEVAARGTVSRRIRGFLALEALTCQQRRINKPDLQHPCASSSLCNSAAPGKLCPSRLTENRLSAELV